MNIYLFSTLTDGQIIPFDPEQDTLFFDDATIDATDIALNQVDAQTTEFTVAGKSIRLAVMGIENIDSFNIMLADGSRLLVGDDTVSPNVDNGGNQLVGGQFNDQLLGLGGDDTLTGGVGNDRIDGGAGSDTANYDDATAAVTVSLALAGPQITGGAGTDTLVNIENLLGSAFNDRLIGNASDNVIEGLDGNDRLDGGSGSDTLSYSQATAAVTVNLSLTSAQNTGGAGIDTVSSFENLTGSSFNDTLTGNTLDNILTGGFGTDIMAGLAGNDTYVVDSTLDQTNEAASAGTDTIVSSVSLTLPNNLENLTLSHLAPFTALNGTGNTLNNVMMGNSGNNILDGKGGIDTVSYAGSPDGVKVNLTFISAQNTGWGRDTLLSMEHLTGSAFDDRLIGNTQNNTMQGGDGDDTLAGGAGNDMLDGQGGNDTGSYFNAAANVTVTLTTTAAQNTGGGGIDTLVNIENLIGSGKNDTLTGNALANVLEGLGGNDTITGGAGSDTGSYASAPGAVTVTLATTGQQNTGSAGNDTLSGIENLLGSNFDDTLTGNSGANRIDGGRGGDDMAGGAGNDLFRVDTNATQMLTVINGNQALVGPPSGTTFTPDVVSEAPGAGTDTVETFVSFVLPANVENLVARELTGSGFVFQSALDLTGNASNNLIVDHRGSNTIDGGGGVDTVSFQNSQGSVDVELDNLFLPIPSFAIGNGFDLLTSIENVIGSGFDDTITIHGVGNFFDGGAGIDTLSYDNLSVAPGAPGVTVNLGLTTPQNTGAGGTATVLNFEHLTGTEGNDTLLGAAGNNILIGDDGSDTLSGGAGNDTLQGSAPFDDGAADTASYSNAPAAVTVNLNLSAAQNTGGAGSDTLISIENLTGSAFNDTLTGDAQNNTLNGGNGNDTLLGGAGIDTLNGGNGNDVLNGGAETDTASYFNAGAAVTVNINLSGAQNTGGGGTDTLSNIENLVGSAFNDTLTGTALGNVIAGLAGNDTINGLAGDDTLTGGAGNDTLNGGAGNNTASYGDAPVAVTVNLGLAGAQNTVGAGTDTLSSINNVIGSAFNDRLTGNTGANTIDGGLGNDTLNGGTGVDTLSYASIVPQFDGVDVNLQSGTVSGAGGNDTITNFENVIGTTDGDFLTGNAGNNVLIGGAGSDILYGGDGTGITDGMDTFVFNSTVGEDDIGNPFDFSNGPEFVSGTDKFQFSQAGIRIGDGDTTVDGGVVVLGPGGFAPTAELVIVQKNVGFLSESTAAAAIGSATGNYAVGATALFAVDDGFDTGLFLFTSSGNNALVSAAELTQLGTAYETASTALGDYLFSV